MNRLVHVFSLVLICLLCLGCETTITFTSPADSDDITDQSTQDGEDNGISENRILDPEVTIPKIQSSQNIQVVFKVEGFELLALIRKMTWFDSEGNTVQISSGAVTLDSVSKHLDVQATSIPKDITQLDIWMHPILLGGGDGWGLEDPIGGGDGWGLEDPIGGGDGWGLDTNNDWYGGGDGWGLDINKIIGGGDGWGIVLPHLIIDRFGGKWENVELRIKLSDFISPTTKTDREALVRKFVENLEAWENGVLVGKGNYEATFAKLTQWGANNTGQDSCFDTWETISCSVIMSSDECANVDYCGQDAQYEEDSGFVGMDEEIYDSKTLLYWNRILDGCGTHCTYEEALAYCTEEGYRLPSYLEARTLINFGTSELAIYQFTLWIDSMRPIWTSSVDLDGEHFCIDPAFGFLVSQSPELLGTTICVSGPEMPEPHVLLPNNVDLFSGSMWDKNETLTTWMQALAICEGSSTLGYQDWRLPNISELTLLLPRIEASNIEEMEFAWSSTTFVDDPEQAWVLSPPVWKANNKNETGRIICVRSIP